MMLEGSAFHSIRLLLVAVLAAAVTLAIPAPVRADVTFVVTSTGNASDRNLADDVCDVFTTAGLQCTLRAAIEEANSTPGADRINFDIQSTAAVKTITPATPLPAITETVTIDGYTQDGASANTLATGNDAVLKIQLNGTNAGADAVGLQVDADDSVIKGVVVNRFLGAGVLLAGADNRLTGSFIGTSPAGDVARPNRQGVLMGGPDTTVGGTGRAARNLISGNTENGVRSFDQEAAGSRVQGNYIGTDRAGTVALGNGGNGVDINSTPNVRIGGTANGAGNLISGNTLSGARIFACATTCRVQGNLIGTDAAGTAALGNGTSGVEAFSSGGTVIGGTTASARNVISGNVANGLRIGIGNTVQGNFIGTDVTGTAALGNGESGLAVLGFDNVIGGSVTGARNVISANVEHGVVFDFPEGAHDNVVQGNLIGTKADGTGDLGNTVQGIELLGGDNVIGGAGAAANVISGNDANGIRIASGFSDGNLVTGNVIRANGLAGVRAEFGPNSVIGNIIFGNGTQGVRISPTAPGTPIKSNQIFGNGGLGIDLSGGTQDGAGVTANDTDDPDTGANGLQNFPVLSSALRASNGVTQVVGSLNSVPSQEFVLQFFLVSADASNHGEALVFIGQKTVNTNSGGDVGWSFATTGLAPGQQVTTTATRSSTNETSEFSLNVTVVPAP